MEEFEFEIGDFARLKVRTPFFDRRPKREGSWNEFSAGLLVRIFRISTQGEQERIHVETLSANYEALILAHLLVKLTPLEQLAAQAE